LPWINSSICEFITKNADEQKNESSADFLAKPTLYWAVLEDRDFVAGKKLKLKPIGKTQVYVGESNNGIQGRWIKDSNNHCEMMKKCLDNVCAMTTYDPLRLEGIQLVDARLALAKVREEKTALFVIKTFGDEFEKAEIALQKAKASLESLKTNSFDDLIIKEAKKSLAQASESCHKYFIKTETSLNQAHESSHKVNDAAKESLRKARESCCKFLDEAKKPLAKNPRPIPVNKVKTSLCEVKKAEEAFREPTATLQELNKEEKERQDKLNKAAAIKELEEAEKCHRDGKRVGGTKIIQGDGIEWLPKDMKYGMNGR
jgi:hypothetical protein